VSSAARQKDFLNLLSYSPAGTDWLVLNSLPLLTYARLAPMEVVAAPARLIAASTLNNLVGAAFCEFFFEQ
jgi:hypothetical protein